LIVEAAGLLRKAGLDAPQREARLLMSLASELTTSELILGGDRSAPVGVVDAFMRMVRRREVREPFQHIAGSTSFFGLEFKSDARALVPRTDSEAVVETALRLLPDRPDVSVADLGTGSGCLLVAILVERQTVKGVGVESDPEAASLAQENIDRHGLGARADVSLQSWAEWEGWGDVDLVMSNPPYIRSEVISTLDPEVQRHDPFAALDGGTDGLNAYREIIRLARERIKPGTPLVLEIGFDQKADVLEILSGAGMVNVGSCPDMSGNDRVVWAIQPRS
jgi:release factor glutamine methyltransferase